jgi:hypothetical protein
MLGVVPDLFYSSTGYVPSSTAYDTLVPSITETAWMPVLEKSAAITMSIALTTKLPDEHFILLLSLGIRFGTLKTTNDVEQVKYVGSAKVLAAV